jgi:putative ABC transport system permease protein
VNLLESIRVALEGIMVSKLRSFLTTLGIVIGIAAVIAVVAIGQGGRAVLMSEMEKIGTNIFAIYLDWRSDKQITGREFSLSDVAVIKDKVPDVTHLSPSSQTMGNIRGTKDNKYSQISGVSSDYSYIRKLNMKEGHFFTDEDDNGKRRVAVLDEDLAAQVFGRSQALGSKITIENTLSRLWA